MGKYSVINLGNIGKPTAEIVNNFVNKISNALGWIVTPKNVNSSIIEANKSIIEEISKRKDINPIERGAIVSNYKKIIKQYKNQKDIISLATEYLTPKAKPESISDDWISFFFDKVKDVTEDDMKIY